MTSLSMDSNKEDLPPQDDFMVGILAYRLAVAISKTYCNSIVFKGSTSYLSQYSELGNKPWVYENLR